MITDFQLDGDIFSQFNYEGKKEINNLSRLNIFIGPNNSGKSIFLRNLFSQRDLVIKSTQLKIAELNDAIKVAETKLKHLTNEVKTHDVLRFITGKSFKEYTDINELTKLFNFHSDLITHRQTLIHNWQTSDTPAAKDKLLKAHEAVSDLLSLFNKTIKIEINEINKPYEFNYIPILRGLRPVNYSNEYTINKNYIDSYKYRTKADYFNNFDVKLLNMHTGLTLFDDVEKNLLSKNADRKKVRAFEEFLSREFFDGAEISLVPAKGTDLILIGIDDIEREISWVGDGIQAIIALLYPIFMSSQKNNLFFIEEPELYMHPGLQRMFINALMSKEFDRHQYFITTHSNHLLEIADEQKQVSIYSFERKIENNNNGDKLEHFSLTQRRHNDTSILDCLGVRNSSVFLSNCTIWVEGITDRKYLKAYMKAYIDKNPDFYTYKEDIHYSFVEYAGSNIVHWNFDKRDYTENINATKISNRIFLIADSDCDTSGKVKESTKKYLRIKELSSELQGNFYLTKGKEIENSLSPAAIENTLKELEGKTDLPFPKNWHIAKNSTAEYSYSFQNIGKFIDEKILKLTASKYADGNTIKNKLKFCNTAISHINSYDDLSLEAINLCEKIFSFIKSNNQ